jgi:hypothetical protein
MEITDDLVDEIFDDAEQVKPRSTFLTVLCILSFVGNGLNIIQGFVIWAMFGIFNSFTKAISSSGAANKGEVAKASQAFNSIGIVGIAYIVGAIICIVGVIFMWRLSRKGFFIYLFGQIIPVASIFNLTLSLPGTNELSFSIFMTIGAAIFPTIFIILYATNLSQLTKK